MTADLVRFATLLAEPLRNGVYKPKQYHGHGTRVINMKELFAHELIDDQATDRVYLEPGELARLRVQTGDLLFARRSFVLEGAGKCSIIGKPSEDTTFESSMIRARLDPKKAIPSFIYYLFRSPLGRAAMASIATSTAVSGITGKSLQELKIPVPPLLVQQKIAAILSAYDDHIENNSRRIKVLEEMAQRIYREWFVAFRYPGHESVSLVNSRLGLIPQGWDVGKLDDLILLQRGFDLPKSRRQDGTVPVIAATGGHGTHSQAKVKGPGVVTGRSGSLGTVMYIVEDFWPLNTTLWVKEYRRASPEYAYFLLQEVGLAGYNSGAAVPTLNRNDISQLLQVLPPPSLMAKFSEYAQNMLGTIHLLGRSTDILSKTRDFLLQSLMSGEIDVTALDIAMHEEAA